MAVFKRDKRRRFDICKKGLHRVLGFGVVKKPYYYVNTDQYFENSLDYKHRGNYRHRVDVNWIINQEESVEKTLPRKTLTRIKQHEKDFYLNLYNMNGDIFSDHILSGINMPEGDKETINRWNGVHTKEWISNNSSFREYCGKECITPMAFKTWDEELKQAERDKIAIQEQAEKDKIAIQEQAEKDKIAIREENLASMVTLAKRFCTDFESVYVEITKDPKYVHLTREEVRKYY